METLDEVVGAAVNDVVCTMDGVDEVAAGLRDKRKSYSRETKLAAVQYFKQCNNKYQTAKRFHVKPSTLRGWLQNAAKIKASHRGTRKIGCGRKAFWPDMEEELYLQYQKLRSDGLKVKGWWFEAKSKELMKDMHPGEEFKFSDGWFTAFKKRKRISYRSTTNMSQKTPNDYESTIREFHKTIRSLASKGEKKGPLGCYELKDIANMDQTPLPFTFNKGKGYDNTGTSTVWHRGAASGLEKRQCTVQLTVFADGDCLKPLLIFRGKGLRITAKEKKEHDSRVVVRFQENAWCDKEVMKFWINSMWKRPFQEAQHRAKLLVADMHRAQTTDEVKELLEKSCHTSIALVPPGTTGLVQPLDVAINAEFKAIVDRLQNEHMHANLNLYIENKMTASQRRVLITKWVGQAWDEVSAKKDMIKRAFEKCGISVPIDGSRDSCINIEGLSDYKVEEQEEGLYVMDTDSDVESESDDSDTANNIDCDSDYVDE
jgi:transposase-like protein